MAFKGGELYGLYTSWRLLSRLQPEPPQGLWDALRMERIDPGNNNLATTGPAATDYIDPRPARDAGTGGATMQARRVLYCAYA